MKHFLLPSLLVFMPRLRDVASRVASAPRRLGVQLLIWSLGMLQRTLNSYWFKQIVLPPVGRMLSCYVVLLVAYQLIKTGTIETGDPRVTLGISELKVHFNVRLDGGGHADRNHGVTQPMTWGLAGVAVVLLLTIVAYHLPGPAIQTAAYCFSVAVPILVLFGILTALQTDPQRPPTLKAVILVNFPIQLAQVLFAVGFAAFLWSYDPRVATVFAMSCGLALRVFQKLSADHFAGPSVPPNIAPPT
jgi:hypothetical protein